MAISRIPQRSRYLSDERWRATLTRLVIGLASGKARALILLLAFLFTVWQLYVFAWQPLSAESDLPAGLTAEPPALNTEALTKIQEARAGRLQHQPNLFLDGDRYFRVSPVTAER